MQKYIYIYIYIYVCIRVNTIMNRKIIVGVIMAFIFIMSGFAGNCHECI